MRQLHQETTFGRGGEITSTFFGKVMFAFALAILVSTLGVWLSFTYLIEIFVNTPSLIWIVFIAELALIFTSPMWSKNRPFNYVLFALFALLTGISITPLLLMATMTAGSGVVVKALLATVFMFMATGIIGWTTKRSLEGMRGFLFITLIGMVIIGVIGMFVPWGSGFEMIYSGIGVILFSAYTMYDFQKIKKYPEDRYIDAALGLYLDIFNLFIFILRLILSQRS
ncbi:Bax inhibitor-1/YccA family protein [bacterium]|nr:Bax inhibitor-1/YccA family protein [bacterium]